MTHTVTDSNMQYIGVYKQVFTLRVNYFRFHVIDLQFHAPFEISKNSIRYTRSRSKVHYKYNLLLPNCVWFQE